MKVATQVREYVDKLSEGTVFKYEDLSKISDNKIAIAKILSRLIAENKISRVKKGIFYKAKKSRFGILNPEIEEVIKAEVKKDKKITGYISGGLIYNKLGLTTQIPNVVEVIVEKRKPPRVISGIKIKYIQRAVKINKQNIEYLQLLDAMKDIKKIPDSKVDESYKILREKVIELENKKKLLDLALEYTPQTRALAGAILSEVSDLDLSKIENSLNKLTKFMLDIKEVKDKKRWHIV